MTGVKTQLSNQVSVAVSVSSSEADVSASCSNEESVEINITSPPQSPVMELTRAVDSLELDTTATTPPRRQQAPLESPQIKGDSPPPQYAEASDSSSSASMDVMNQHSKEIDISEQVSQFLDNIDDDEPLSLDRTEAAAKTTIEDKADYILSEARSMSSPVASSPRTPENDARAKEILEKARRQAAKSKGRKIRTTEEVLQLAGQVLGKTASTTPSPPKQRVALKLQEMEFKSAFDFDESKLSSSSSSSDEIRYKINVLQNNTPVQTLLSEDSTPEAQNEIPTKTSPDRKFSLMGLFRCEAGSPDRVVPSPPPPDKKRLRGVNNLFSCTRRESVFSTDEDELNEALEVSPVNSMLKADRPFPPLSYAASLRPNQVDPRMPAWMANHGEEGDLSQPLPDENFYSLGPSRAIVVHEIVRGDWTWCTAWSPDGGRLALATENHHLAVVETTSSTVWRVRHDQRISRPMKNGTTHTIRSIAWGQNFIAIGGTGNAVSILAPIEPYPVLHTIPDTGFVGSLSWRTNSTVLAIGSREDKCIVVNISAADGDGGVARGRHIRSTVLHTISRTDWVNAVSFSPGGTALAVGDRSGKLSVYRYDHRKPSAPPEISSLCEIVLEDSVLDIEWSPDGKWLYAGGEDFAVSVIETATWNVIRQIERKKWVQFIASSNRGSHVAVGGVASEVSILDVKEKWKQAMKIELKGLVPLSAKWHPKDQYLALTGQDNSVVVVETTNARHVYGHCLHSISPVLEVEFSPDGQMVVIGNEAGVVSFFALEGSVFVTRYEMVLCSGESQSIRWSPNGQYVVIGTGDQVIVITKISEKKMDKMPPNAAGFSVRKVIRGLGKVRSISIDDTCRYVAVGGTTTQILDAADQFACIREWKKKIVQCNAFSPDGTWLASIGRNENLTIYKTDSIRVDKWRVVFTLKAIRAGLALAWGPAAVEGLQYLAYGGANSVITIIEIRTTEETWETVLEIPRAGVIHDLDWNNGGMLAAAIGDGTVTIIDLEYLQSGWAMNEMDYTWQRQGITCFTEVRRNKGKNSMRTVRWIPSIDRDLLAIGGTDGDLEIVDLTSRDRCQGFHSKSPPQQTREVKN